MNAELTPWIVFLAAVAALLVDRPRRARQARRCDVDQEGPPVERGVDRPRPVVLAGRVGLARRRGGPGVPRRLPHRGIAEHRQPLRLPARVRLSGHRAAVPAQGALLGHPRGDRHARRVHLRRCGRARAVLLGHVPVRGAARGHGDQAAALSRRPGRSAAQPDGPCGATPLPGRARVRGQRVHGAARRPPHADAAGDRPRRRRVGRRRVRRRLGAGRPRRLRRRVRRVHLERGGDPRPALAVLRACGEPAALRVPQLGPGRRARLRGREDAARRRRDIPIYLSLAVIVIAVGGSIVASLWLTRGREKPGLTDGADPEQAEEA